MEETHTVSNVEERDTKRQKVEMGDVCEKGTKREEEKKKRKRKKKKKKTLSGVWKHSSILRCVCACVLVMCLYCIRYTTEYGEKSESVYTDPPTRRHAP